MNTKNFEISKMNTLDLDSIKNILEKLDITGVDGILLDLGVSSYQLDERKRGFSYLGENELDMRMDRTQTLTAKDVVNTYKEEDLANLIYEYGEERFSRQKAKNICKYRKEKNEKNTLALLLECFLNIQISNKIQCKKFLY